MFKRLLKLWFVPVSVHAKLIEDYRQTLDLLQHVQGERDKLAKFVLALDERVRKSEARRDEEAGRFQVEMTAAQKTMAMAADAFEKQKDRILKLQDAVARGVNVSVARESESILLEGDEAVRQAIAELAVKGNHKLN